MFCISKTNDNDLDNKSSNLKVIRVTTTRSRDEVLQVSTTLQIQMDKPLRKTKSELRQIEKQCNKIHVKDEIDYINVEKNEYRNNQHVMFISKIPSLWEKNIHAKF